MKKTLLTHSILEIFIEWKSQGITNGRIAGILGIHYNTLSNWINKGREIAARIEHEEENYLSIFNQNDLVIGVKNELLYKLFIENDRQHHVACAKSEIRAIKTGNIPLHLNVVRLLNDSKDLPLLLNIENEEDQPPTEPPREEESKITITKDDDIKDFLKEDNPNA